MIYTLLLRDLEIEIFLFHSPFFPFFQSVKPRSNPSLQFATCTNRAAKNIFTICHFHSHPYRSPFLVLASPFQSLPFLVILVLYSPCGSPDPQANHDYIYKPGGAVLNTAHRNDTGLRVRRPARTNKGKD